MNNFDDLVSLIISEAPLSTIKNAIKTNVKRAVSPSSWMRGAGSTLRGAGKVASVLRDPYSTSKGSERIAQTLTGLGNILSPDPSKQWDKPDAETSLKTGKDNLAPKKVNERDYFFININGKSFAGKVTKVAGGYVFVKMFKHPKYGSAILKISPRKTEIFFYKEKIPSKKSKYIKIHNNVTTDYDLKKRRWQATVK